MNGRIRGQIEVKSPYGLHLRVADQFVQLAQGFMSDVRVARGATIADGKSVLDLLTLGAACGEGLQLEIEGPDAPAALHALTDLMHVQLAEFGGAA